MKSYYIDNKRKIQDFVMGFFGILILAGIIFIVPLSILGSLINEGFVFYWLPLILLVISLLLMVLFFKISRKYIAIGILSSTVFLLLVYVAFWSLLINAMRASGEAGL